MHIGGFIVGTDDWFCMKSPADYLAEVVVILPVANNLSFDKPSEVHFILHYRCKIWNFLTPSPRLERIEMHQLSNYDQAGDF